LVWQEPLSNSNLAGEFTPSIKLVEYVMKSKDGIATDTRDEFDNSFEVPLPPAEAWQLLSDVRRIIPCMPGAELTEVLDDTTYKGKISVPLGPVSLVFAGVLKIEEVNPTNHTARVTAYGVDAKDSGGANAIASFELKPEGSGSRVLVHTELVLSGGVAEYGYAVRLIKSTAARLLNQFAANLQAQVTEGALAADVS
jgi:uncharacterized protein